MNSVRDLHHAAMAKAELGFAAKRQNNPENALRLFIEAYQLEFEAAQQATEEPTRSILYRSASTLALHAQHYREAERIAAFGLTGEPPTEIANELRDVMEQARVYLQPQLEE